jgi:hypothetical protein
MVLVSKIKYQFWQKNFNPYLLRIVNKNSGRLKMKTVACFICQVTLSLICLFLANSLPCNNKKFKKIRALFEKKIIEFCLFIKSLKNLKIRLDHFKTNP